MKKIITLALLATGFASCTKEVQPAKQELITLYFKVKVVDDKGVISPVKDLTVKF